MIQFAIVSYVGIIVSALGHEIFHWAVAKLLNLHVKNIVLGSELLSFKYRKLRLSPIISTGYVEVNYDELVEKSNLNIITFFIAGPAFNILFGIFLLHLYLSYELLIWLFLTWFNGVCFVISILPLPNSDYRVCKSIIQGKTIQGSIE